MSPAFPTVAEIAADLAPALDAARYEREGDPAGVWIASERPVRRLGLRLDAGHAPYLWLREDVDALVVHRPFGLWPARLPAGLGVVAMHRALDDRLSTGWNAPLARALGLALDVEPMRRRGQVVGMVGTRVGSASEALERVQAEFGGMDDLLGEATGSGRVAVVGAMTAALVEDAAARSVRVYVTGEIRKPGVDAARRAGMCVVAVGQARSERWGLRLLGRLVSARWPEVDVLDLAG